jgi:chitodextrinase
MGFIKEVYSDNRAGLVVAFGRGKNSATYFEGDSISAAMKYFNIYLKGNNMYIKTEDEKAIEELGIQREDAVEFRSTIDSIIVTLTDEQAIAAPVLFPIWQANVNYKVGDRIRYEGKLYKAIQEHTSQIGWEPIVAASLFTAILVDEENNNILAWAQPDSTNGYMMNDKVIHNEKFWISISDNNVWEPETVGAPWVEYIATWENGVSYAMNQKVAYGDTTYISLIKNNTAEPIENKFWMVYVEPEIETPEVEENEISEWTQLEGGKTYMMGDKVMFKEKIYESLIDNNVWSPADYPAGWIEIEE